MACATQSIHVPLQEELYKPELAVPRHEPISTSRAQPEPAATASARITPRITVAAPERTLMRPAPSEPRSSIAITGIPRQSFSPDEVTPEAHLLHGETNSSPATEAITDSALQNPLLNPAPEATSTRNARTRYALKSPSWLRNLQLSFTTSSRKSYTGSSTEASTAPATASTFTVVSFASSRTSIDTSHIEVTKESPDIYLWCEERNIYLGKSRELPVPEGINAQWRHNIRERLVVDVGYALQSIGPLPRGKLILEMDLCMAGEPNSARDLVDLFPTVLIRCGSKRCLRAVDKAVKDLGYLREFSKGRILVHRKAPRLASRSDTMAWSGDVVDSTPELRISRPDTQSGCSIPLLYTPNTGCEPRTALIGGLIRVDDQVYGLTAAHSVIEIETHCTYDATSISASSSESLSESETEASSASSASSAFPKSTLTRERHLPDLIDRDESIESIESIESTETLYDTITYQDGAFVVSYCYGSQRQPSSNTSAFLVSTGSDFALVDLPESYRHMPNKYFETQSQDSTQRSQHVTKLVIGEAPSGTVSIICSPTDVRSAFLLDGDHLFLDQATVFSTRKLQTQAPLEQGLSGAWVVVGEHLLGVITAVYDDEPYAHMLEISKVFSDIRALLSSGDHVPEITLLDQSPRADTTGDCHLKVPFNIMKSGKKVKELSRNKLLISDHEERMFEESRIRPFHASLRERIQLGAIVFAAFCIDLDVAMLPFLLSHIANTFGALNHLGLYTGLYYMLTFLCRPVYEALCRAQFVRMALVIALSTSFAGLICCACAPGTGTFIIGRCLTACGSAGIKTCTMPQSSHDPLFRWCSMKRAVVLSECVALLLGTILASLVTADQIAWRWRICFILNAALLFPSCIIFSVNIRDYYVFDLWPMPPRRRNWGSVLVIVQVVSGVAITVLSTQSGLDQLPMQVGIPVAVLMFLCTVFEPVLRELQGHFAEWGLFKRLANARGPEQEWRTTKLYWRLLISDGVGAAYMGLSHFNRAVIMLVLPFGIQTATGSSSIISGLIYTIALVPLIIFKMLVQSRRGFASGFVMPGSLLFVSVGSIIALRYFSNHSSIGLLVTLELLVGTGIGLTSTLRTCEDDWLTAPGVFEAAGVALAHTVLLNGLTRQMTTETEVFVPSVSELQARFDKEYGEALGWVFSVPFVASCVALLIFGAPQLISAVWRGAKRLSKTRRERDEKWDTTGDCNLLRQHSRPHNQPPAGLTIRLLQAGSEFDP